MKKPVFLAIIVLSFSLTSATIVFSQNTPDATQTRLQQIENKTATQGANLASASVQTKKARTISFIQGTVIGSGGRIISIDTSNSVRTVFTSDSTKFINLDSSGKKLIGFGDIKGGDTLLVIGLPSTSVSGSAKIVVRDQTKSTKTFAQLGQVLNNKDNTLVIADIFRTDIPNLSLSLPKEAVVSADKNQTLDQTLLTAGRKLVAAGIVDDKGLYIIKRIFVLNYSRETATTSAK